MKSKLLFPKLLAFALLSACASRSGIAPRADLLGQPAPPSAATYTIPITPGTRWVNVTGGDTVRFVVGDKAFAWNFTVSPIVSSFELNRVAPPGLLDHKVRAYVAPNPFYYEGGWGLARW
jgi:hypothetical protein